jgi:membrane protease YdiL (CAAX protease family)
LKDKGFNLFGLRITFPVLMSAIAFSMAHLILLASGASGLFVTRVLVFTFVLGLIAGYYQEKHDNIAYAILVHAAGNILGLMSTILTAG